MPHFRCLFTILFTYADSVYIEYMETVQQDLQVNVPLNLRFAGNAISLSCQCDTTGISIGSVEVFQDEFH